ncbi:MAG: hypothetical protein ACOZFS_04425 [Thermodesulfobacteriota bacterium]
MTENQCHFCEKTPKHFLLTNGMKVGFCEKCKTYSISKISDIIRREGLTPNRVRERDIWNIVGFQPKEAGMPQYTGDFPLEWKEEAIRLAKIEKNI